MAEWLGEGGGKMAECGMEAPDLVHVRQMVFSAPSCVYLVLSKPPLPPLRAGCNIFLYCKCPVLLQNGMA